MYAQHGDDTILLNILALIIFVFYCALSLFEDITPLGGIINDMHESDGDSDIDPAFAMSMYGSME
jgi:hypothetical protein